MTPRCSRRQRAFSMLELLVVIGIVVILLAILLPVIGKLRESGRRTACMSNLRQIGGALVTYRNDYNGYPSATVYWTATYPARLDIREYLRPYRLPNEIWECQSDGIAGFGLYEGYGNSFYYVNSYSRPFSGGVLKPGHIGFISADGKTTQYAMPIIFDNVPNHAGKNMRAAWSMSASPYAFTPESDHAQLLRRDLSLNKGFNSLWTDGHVETGKGEDWVRYLTDNYRADGEMIGSPNSPQ